MTTSTKTADRIAESVANATKYVQKAPTANLQGFAEYAIAVNEVPLKTAADRDAFALGNRLAGLRSRFTADRKAGLSEATETFADYVIRVSGVKIAAAHRPALLAGIATYSQYVSYRNARNDGSLAKILSGSKKSTKTTKPVAKVENVETSVTE